MGCSRGVVYLAYVFMSPQSHCTLHQRLVCLQPVLRGVLFSSFVQGKGAKCSAVVVQIFLICRCYSVLSLSNFALSVPSVFDNDLSYLVKKGKRKKKKKKKKVRCVDTTA